MPNKYNKIVVAIDGGIGTGTSTLSRHVAEQLDAFYFDPGILYRMVAYEMREDGVNESSLSRPETIGLSMEDIRDKVHTCAKSMTLEKYADIMQQVDQGIIDLRSEELGRLSSQLWSHFPEMREYITAQQRKAKDHPKGAVLEGRDTFRIIAPKADVKILLTASDEVAAARKYAQLRGTANAVASEEEMLHLIQKRNEGIKKLPGYSSGTERDVVVIDTTGLTIEQVQQKAMALVSEKLCGKQGRAV